MIFPGIELEDIVQTGDKTRLDASKSYASKGSDAVTNVEIEAEGGSGFVTVFHADPRNWFLDWQYSGSARSVTVSVRVTTGVGIGIQTATSTKTIQVTTSAIDKLFSSDSDLIALEPDILKWCVRGRSSFLNVHRMAQKKIVEWFDETGARNDDGTKVSKNELIDISEVGPWSRDLTLSLIFMGISNQNDDVFFKKSKHYESQAKNRANRAIVAWDSNKDSVIDQGEHSDQIQSVVVVR